MDSKFFSNLIPEEDGFYLDLFTSASIGCDERVRDIIDNAENKQILNIQNKCGWTPLMYAACSTNLKILLFMLEEGACVDMKNNLGQTALIIASKCGSTDIVSLLVDFKANVSITDSRGWTAAFYAASFGHRSVLQLLIEKGGIVDIVDKNEGLSPLMLSSAAGHEMIVKDLLLLGLNPGLESKTGETARSLAVKYGHHNVKNLIDTYFHSKKNNMLLPQKSLSHSSESDLRTVLHDLQLSKYYYIFEKQGIDLNTFWMLTDEDLKEIGINVLGPRKKMCLAISRYNNNYKQFNTEDNNLLNKLSTENKRLIQRIDQLEKELMLERDARKMAEKNLNDGIITFKSFIDNIQHSSRFILTLEEKLQQNYSNLKKNLYYTPDINSEQFKRDFIFPLLEGSERLLNDIHHQILLSSQQTDFRH